MTALKKTVSRTTLREVPGVRKKLVVSLEPGDLLTLREQGRRKKYSIGLQSLYWMLAKANVK